MMESVSAQGASVIETERETRNAEDEEGSEQSVLSEEEKSLRNKVQKGCGGNYCIAVLINMYSSVLIFSFYLISLECLISIALSVYFTICKYVKMFQNGRSSVTKALADIYPSILYP